jgi:hypothetical protein
MNKELIINKLLTFANSRPGLDPNNYADYKGFRSEQRETLKDLAHARTLIQAVAATPAITGELMVEKIQRGDRLFMATNDFDIYYTAGQYYPTEYRKAVCRFCADLLWQYVRAAYPHFDGTDIRASFRRWFGLAIQKRYFN